MPVLDSESWSMFGQRGEAGTGLLTPPHLRMKHTIPNVENHWIIPGYFTNHVNRWMPSLLLPLCGSWARQGRSRIYGVQQKVS
jgi:hypothetical protein